VTIDELALQLRTVAADPATRVLVIRGAGEHFGAGADLKERATMTPDERFAHSRAIAETIAFVGRMKIPTIAAIDGYAVGGAFELALACDLRVISDRATLALTETRIGAFPGAGGTQRLSRLVGASIAKDLIFTGRHVKADEALRLGLANRVEPADRLHEAAGELAATIAANAPLAVAYAKQAIEVAAEGSIAAGLEYESAAIRVLFGSDDYAEGLASFAERRPPRFTGT
jgi:enoyl-CoA hydratase/carnithine racemase